jgi:hypothetical protein
MLGFLNIFAEKFGKKSAFFAQSKAKLCKNSIITLVYEKNANFLPKIGENFCDNIINPWSP